MQQIVFKKGDATAPIGAGPKIICHICNDVGGWGAGFVLAISKRWKQPERAYREWYHSGENFQLGEIQLVPVTEDVTVANTVCGLPQTGCPSGMTPCRPACPNWHKRR